MRWGLNFRTGGLEMNKKLHSEAVDQLFEAILCLKNKEECYTFFENVAGEENVSGNLRKDGSIHGDDQPREPFLKLWKRRI